MSEPSPSPRYLEAPSAELAARRAATRLRNVLRLNTAFSALSGVVALVAAGPVADLLGIEPAWLVRVTGGSLLGFAVVVLVVAGARTTTLTRWARLISAADLAWVLATVGVVAAGLVTTSGAVTLGLVAVPVLALGLGQMRARRQLVTAGDGAGDLDEWPPVEVVDFSRPSAHPVERLWPVITDHALYARLALNLKAAEGLTPDGPGFQRACTDGAGRTWSETCTLWDPGRRFDVDVDIADYPYPLRTVQGSWRVDPGDPTGRRAVSTIGMAFALQPAPGVAGRLFLPLMHLLFRPILARIARGWEAEAGRRPADGPGPQLPLG